jgi:protein-disulfide isomerase
MPARSRTTLPASTRLVLALVGASITLLPGALGAQESSVPPAEPNPDAPTRTKSGKIAASKDPATPALGPASAKVVVVVFSDFQCPVCRRITDATHQIPEEWPGDVRVEFRELPLGIHSNAENAAVAALAAHRQGKFWQMHDVLFANQAALDEANLPGYAKQAGCDEARFRKDYADPKLRQRVRDDAALGAKLGLDSTPSFLMNGKSGVGWASWNAFRGQVDQERQAVNALVAKGTKVPAAREQRAREALTDPAAFTAYKTAVLDPLTRPGKAR